MRKKLRLYLWTEVLCDYTHGVMFALATSPEEARKLLLETCSYLPADELAREPQEIESPFAYHLWGGS